MDKPVSVINGASSIFPALYRGQKNWDTTFKK